jgi:DNA polymerase-3 subunit epsilon
MASVRVSLVPGNQIFFMLWRDKIIHVLDFEGTRRTGVIEFGVVTLQDGLLEATCTGFCRSRTALKFEDAKVHGIVDEMIANKEPFEKEWDRFSLLREKGLMAAHHASVEDNLLKDTWPYPRLSDGVKRLGWGPWIDTRRIYAELYKGLDSYGLGHLTETFDLGERLMELAARHCPPDRRKVHCALYDALATALLLLRLDEMPELKAVTTHWLLEISAPDRRRRDELRQGDFFSG